MLLLLLFVAFGVLVVFTVDVVEAKSNVVESTANSVGEPTKSKAIDDTEVLEAGPEVLELFWL